MSNTPVIQEYSDQKRLEIYKIITSACTHLYSKGSLQVDKFNAIITVFADIAKNDPLFMAHLTAWAAKGESKDLAVVATFFNALSDADGTPFYKGANLNKPNLRAVSYATLQGMAPHLAGRVLELCHHRFEVKDILNSAKHFPTGLKTAFRKYIQYREQNPEMLRGIRKSGLTHKMQQLYRLTHTAPSDEAVSILGWKQKDGRVIEKESLPDFSDKSADEIVELLKSSKLSTIVAISMIPPEKITAKVAAQLLKNCTGNQSIILYNWFAKNGFLDVKAVKDLFKDKVKQSTTAIDRIDTLTRNADINDKIVMSQIRSEKRKEVAKTKEIGKIYMHIDASASMSSAIAFAKDKACVIAECVSDPTTQFKWGLFGNIGKSLPLPKAFAKENFHAALYGVTANMGSTDCIALYKEAREFGAEVDVYVTDQGHNVGSIVPRVEKIHHDNPALVKPKVAVIVDFSGNRNAQRVNQLEEALRRLSIPVAIIYPDALKESALVAQSIKAALKGETAIIDEIMETKLPNLPQWYYSVVESKTGNKVEA